MASPWRDRSSWCRRRKARETGVRPARARHPVGPHAAALPEPRRAAGQGGRLRRSGRSCNFAQRPRVGGGGQMLTFRGWVRQLLWVSILALCGTGYLPAAAAGPLDKINHVIVIFQENWSFDGLYGKFPGANGLAMASSTVPQVDKTGKPYDTLPIRDRR